MKTLIAIATASTALACAIAAPSAHAGLANRYSVEEAAGACQPFSPSNSVRYNSTGLRNAGTTTLYVVCSMAGTWRDNSDGGGTYSGIKVNNPTGASQTISCTARPGYVYGTTSLQAASPKSAVVAAGTYRSLDWEPVDFGGSKIRNPNFTCALPPGTEIQYLEYDYAEEIGS